MTLKALKDYQDKQLVEELSKREIEKLDKQVDDTLERQRALIFANTHLTKDEVKSLPLEVVGILFDKFTSNN